MKSILLVVILIMQLSISQPSVCFSHPPPLELSQLPVKINTDYTFKIYNYASQVNLVRNKSGTFFIGDFSQLELRRKNVKYQYQATSFSFKYPPQHRIAQVQQDVLEMQINYQLATRNLSKWKHQSLVLSVNFVATEYAPTDGFTLGNQINRNLQNGSSINFDKLIPLVSGLNMLIYKGIHSESPQNESTLWLVRREFLLMSRQELSQIKNLFISESNGSDLEYHGLLKRTSDINEISESTEMEEKQTIEVDL